jgi:transcriptional regulator with XRE-family HTH domain
VARNLADVAKQAGVSEATVSRVLNGKPGISRGGFRVDRTLDKEAGMPLARVVSFDGVDSDRMAEMQREMQGGGERPDNVPAKEIVVLHDPEGEKSLVILFFESEADYKQGDEALNAMPTGDTPGKRTSVTKYDVAFRMTD